MEVAEFFLTFLIILLSAKFFAEVGKKSGIFDDFMYAIIVFVVAMTTLFAPVLLRIVMRDEE